MIIRKCDLSENAIDIGLWDLLKEMSGIFDSEKGKWVSDTDDEDIDIRITKCEKV